MVRRRAHWEIALAAFREAPSKTLFAADLAEAGVPDPARAVRDLRAKGYRVEADGSDWTEHERGTRYLFYGKKRHRNSADKAGRPPVGAAAPRAAGWGPTFVETTLDYSDPIQPVHSTAVLEREADIDPPEGPGRLRIVTTAEHLARIDRHRKAAA